ncbi:MAG: hypothetical protein ABI162_03925 [Luteolibacter sp.]
MPREVEMLAPLQKIMLRDSLEHPEAGVHVEQVEIVFANEFSGESIAAVWNATVSRTKVLQMTFVIEEGEPVSWEIAAEPGFMKWDEPSPVSWEVWLEEDRVRRLLCPAAVPWRARYWAGERRMVWTFHHALLDGRSIARILRGFLNSLRRGISPVPLAITRWSSADGAMIAEATKFFSEEFAHLEACGSTPRWEPKAVRCLGNQIAAGLESLATEMQISTATILTWTWGQAVARASGMDYAVVEQVRCGPPQIGTAGFSMNTLPMVIHRGNDAPIETQLRDFRSRLLTLRGFESISPYDLPPEVVQIANAPWSSVIMTERGNLAHMAEAGNDVESIKLHEWPGESLTAMTYLLPDLRLEVEGGANQELIYRWSELIENMRHP